MTRQQFAKFLELTNACSKHKRGFTRYPEKTCRQLWDDCRNPYRLYWLIRRLYTFFSNAQYDEILDIYYYTAVSDSTRARQMKEVITYKEFRQAVLAFNKKYGNDQ